MPEASNRSWSFRSLPSINCACQCSTIVETLPAPQRDALRTAFGLRSGPRPDRFLVGLAVLTLLSDAAEPQPLICVVDDAQWLDRCSAQVLSFVARRLQAESVIMLFAEREQDQPTELAGLPELALQRLSDDDARELALLIDSGTVRRKGRVSGSSTRHVGTRSRCSSCLAVSRRRVSPAALRWRIRCRL